MEKKSIPEHVVDRISKELEAKWWADETRPMLQKQADLLTDTEYTKLIAFVESKFQLGACKIDDQGAVHIDIVSPPGTHMWPRTFKHNKRVWHVIPGYPPPNYNVWLSFGEFDEMIRFIDDQHELGNFETDKDGVICITTPGPKGSYVWPQRFRYRYIEWKVIPGPASL